MPYGLAAIPALATETENLGIRVLPASGKMVSDGKTDDWDLSGGVFVCGVVVGLRSSKAGRWPPTSGGPTWFSGTLRPRTLRSCRMPAQLGNMLETKAPLQVELHPAMRGPAEACGPWPAQSEKEIITWARY